MKIIIRDIRENDSAADALILPLCEATGSFPYQKIDASLSGLIGKVISSKEFLGKPNQVSVLHAMNRIKPRRILLVGMGKAADISTEKIRQAGGRAVSHLRDIGCKDIALSASYLNSIKQSPVPFIEGGLLSLYRFTKYKKENEEPKELDSLTVIGKTTEGLKEEIKWTMAVTSAVNFARDLVNTPSNDMTPTALARKAKSISGKKISVKVLDRAAAAAEGMGAYLSVAKGSMEPPRFIVVRYEGGEGAPIALIGKSITFDSGGISIKPSEGMEKMKYDMAGGAAVLAVIKTAAETNLPLNIIGILPATENLPGGSASKPGDIVSSAGGKTIEIINTDAEGRLALADAIGYIKKFEPEVIIDIATLTGACSVALGNEAIAMMGNDNNLMKGFKAAGDETYERVWQMPLYEEYLEYIKSDVADLKNSGGKTGSLVTAGYFLKEFAGNTPWVHLDIAATAWMEKEKPYIPKGATGVGVRLLLNYLKGVK